MGLIGGDFVMRNIFVSVAIAFALILGSVPAARSQSTGIGELPLISNGRRHRRQCLRREPDQNNEDRKDDAA